MCHSNVLFDRCVLTDLQEGYLAKHAISEEDNAQPEEGVGEDDGPMDPMQGLEQLDVAGPRLA